MLDRPLLFICFYTRTVFTLSIPAFDLADTNTTTIRSRLGVPIGVVSGNVHIGNAPAYCAALELLNHLAWNDYLGFEQPQWISGLQVPGVQIYIGVNTGGLPVQRKFLVEGLEGAVAYFASEGLITNSTFVVKDRGVTAAYISFERAGDTTYKDQSRGPADGQQAESINRPSSTNVSEATQSDYSLRLDQSANSELNILNTSSLANKSNDTPTSGLNESNSLLHVPLFWLDDRPVSQAHLYALIAATYAVIAPEDRRNVVAGTIIETANDPFYLYLRVADPLRTSVQPFFRYDHVLRALYKIVWQSFERHPALFQAFMELRGRGPVVRLGELHMLPRSS